MTTTIDNNQERILIKYINNFITYKCVITKNDTFVVNFCKRELDKMEIILRNHVLVEMGDNFMLKVENPVYLEYELIRDKSDETGYLQIIQNLEKENIKLKKINEEYLQTIKRLEEENIEHKKIETQSIEKPEVTDDYIFFGGLSIGFINKKLCDSLLLIHPSMMFSQCELDSFCPYMINHEVKGICGSGIELVLSRLSELGELRILKIWGEIIFDLEYLKNCKNLNVFAIGGTNLWFEPEHVISLFNDKKVNYVCGDYHTFFIIPMIQKN